MKTERQRKAELASQPHPSIDLRGAGFSASDLRLAGYSASALRGAGYSASELRGAGFSASDLRLAGYSASELRGAGFRASALRGAGFSASTLSALGYSASDLRDLGFSASALKELEESIPLVEKPYTKIWADIQSKARVHDQQQFGPECDPEQNLCGTPMCTAGHLVNLGGELGYALQDRYGFPTAAALIHFKAHPDWPCQNFGNIPQDLALAYIEEMAYRESLT
jgi:ribosomal protein L13E